MAELLRSVFYGDWTEDEKARLHYALTSFGPRNMRAVTNHVATKNIVQVQSYVEMLKILASRHPCDASEYPEAVEDTRDEKPATPRSSTPTAELVRARSQSPFPNAERDLVPEHPTTADGTYDDLLHWNRIKQLYGSTDTSAPPELTSPTSSARIATSPMLVQRRVIDSLRAKVRVLVRTAILCQTERERLEMRLGKDTDPRVTRADVASGFRLLGLAVPQRLTRKRRRTEPDRGGDAAVISPSIQIPTTDEQNTRRVSRRTLPSPTPRQMRVAETAANARADAAAASSGAVQAMDTSSADSDSSTSSASTPSSASGSDSDSESESGSESDDERAGSTSTSGDDSVDSDGVAPQPNDATVARNGNSATTATRE